MASRLSRPVPFHDTRALVFGALGFLFVGLTFFSGIRAETTRTEVHRVEREVPIVQKIGSPCRSTFNDAIAANLPRSTSAIRATRYAPCFIQGALNGLAVCQHFDLHVAYCDALRDYFFGTSLSITKGGGASQSPQNKGRQLRGASRPPLHRSNHRFSTSLRSA